MDTYHKTSPIRTESLRTFLLIHEITSSQSQTLKAESLDKLLKKLQIPCNQDLVKFMHSIDKSDKEMNAEYWSQSISMAMSNFKLSNELDYLRFHEKFKQLIQGEYLPPLEAYETWDGNLNKSQEDKNDLYAKIVSNCGQLSLFIKKIDYMMFSSNIVSINECFSLITLMPYKKDEILQIYENILSGNFLETLQFALTTNVEESLLIEMLKSLCYLYQSMKFERINKILETTFLLDPTTLRGLLQNISDKRSEIRYFTCSLIAAMINNVEILPVVILEDRDLLYSLSNCISDVKEHEGLKLGVEFLIGIVKEFRKFNEEQVRENGKILSVYMNFAVKKLWELKSEETQSVCIKLVEECVKVSDFNEEDTKILKFINNVFEGTNERKFQSFYEICLNIVMYSIIYNRKNVKSFVLSDKSFLNYLKRILSNSHEEWEPFYQSLQIISIIAKSDNSDILFQNDLIQTLFTLIDSNSGLTLTYLSEILLSLIVNSLDSEWKITFLYEKECLRVIGGLIGKCATKDVILSNEYMSQKSISYGNWQTLINSLKSLYYLSVDTSQKRKELYIKNFSTSFINSFLEGNLSLFTLIEDQVFLSSYIRSQHLLYESNPKVNLKLCAIISKTIEEMTIALRKRNTSIEILKRVNHSRTEIYKKLYETLTYNELIIENIPIYLVYSSNIESMQIKEKVYRLSWHEFRSLLWEFVKKTIKIESASFRIIDKYNGLEIRNEDDYRKTIERILNEYNISSFNLETQIIDIREKSENTSLNGIVTTNSLRMQETEYNRYTELPKFMSNRMPQVRDNSIRMSNSRNERNASPNFGTACRECSRTTTNRSQICNSCVQNHKYN